MQQEQIKPRCFVHSGKIEFGLDKVVSSVAVVTKNGIETGEISVGFEDSSLVVVSNQELEQGRLKPEKLYISTDSNFPVVDHCWYGKSLVCITSGKSIMIYDYENNRVVHTLIGHLDFILCLKKGPLENLLVSAGDDRSIMVWDLRTFKPINYILAHSSAITSLDVFKDSSIILSTSDEGYARMWDMHNGECLRTLSAFNTPPIVQGKFTLNSDLSLFATLDGKVSLFNMRTGRLIREYRGHINKEFILDIVFTKNSKHDLDGFIIGSENGMIFRFNWQQTTPIDCLHVEEDGLASDLIQTMGNQLYVSGRGWSCLSRVEYPLDAVSSNQNMNLLVKHASKHTAAGLQLNSFNSVTESL